MAPDRATQLTDSERQQAVEAFEKLGLCTQLAEAAAALGWKRPSNIQEQAIPNVLQGTVFSLLPKALLKVHLCWLAAIAVR